MNCSLKVTLFQSAPSLPWCPLSLKVPFPPTVPIPQSAPPSYVVPTLPQSAPPFSQSDPKKTTANFWPEALWWSRHNKFCPMQPMPPLFDHLLRGIVREGQKTTCLFAVEVLPHHVQSLRL